MAVIRIQEAASLRLDDIYRYTRNRWGEQQAESYIKGMFAAFDKIAERGVASKPIPAEFGVNGYFSVMSGISYTGDAFPTASSAS